MKLLILEDYHNCKKKDYNTLLTKVTNGIYGIDNIGSFATPAITKVAFNTLVTDYRNANNEYEAGGKDEKPAYEVALGNMTTGLDILKKYVEELPNLTLDIINLSGFTAYKQSTSSSSVPLPPDLNVIERIGGGTMTFNYDSSDGAEFYGSIVVEGSSLPVGYTFINGILDYPKTANARLLYNVLKQRFKTYHNLTLSQEYTIYSYAGNSAGISPLSIGVTFTASNK